MFRNVVSAFNKAIYVRYNSGMVSSRLSFLNSDYKQMKPVVSQLSFFRSFSARSSCAALHSYYGQLDSHSPFIKEVNLEIQNAELFANLRIAEYKQTNPNYMPAIVFDIDDTSVSHFPVFKKSKFVITSTVIDDAYMAASSPAIMPVLNFYKSMQSKGVSTFFITARKHSDKTVDLHKPTVNNLESVGYTNYTGLFLPQTNEDKQSTVQFKTRIRKSLEEQGYKIILNIGDQPGDFEGGHAERIVKIPNYLYGAPKPLNNMPSSNVQPNVPSSRRPS